MNNSNNPQSDQNQPGEMRRSNSLRYSQQQEINQRMFIEEEIKSTSNNVWVYIWSLILIGILWLCGRSQNWGDDVSGLVKYTLVIYISTAVIISALWALVLKKIIGRGFSFIIKLLIFALQVAWYIHWVDTKLKNSKY